MREALGIAAYRKPLLILTRRGFFIYNTCHRETQRHGEKPNLFYRDGQDGQD